MNLHKKGLTTLMQLGVLFVQWVSIYAIETCVMSCTSQICIVSKVSDSVSRVSRCHHISLITCNKIIKAILVTDRGGL
jgi:hypothetical protein